MLWTVTLIAFGLGGIVYGEYQRRLHEATTLEREYWKGQSKSNDARAENWRKTAGYWEQAALEEEQENIELQDQLESLRWQLEHTRRNGPFLDSTGVPEHVERDEDRPVSLGHCG